MRQSNKQSIHNINDLCFRIDTYSVIYVIVQQMALIPISLLVLQSYESLNLLYHVLSITGTLMKSLYSIVFEEKYQFN